MPPPDTVPPLRIALVSRAFHPLIGGIETHSALLAGYLQARGHQVTVVTEAALPEGDTEPFPFSVVRRPDFLTAARLMAASDLVVHNQISLRALPPWLLSRRPLVLVHQTWLHDERSLKNRLAAATKRLACRWGANFTCSAALGRELDLEHVVIPNSFNDTLFHLRPATARNRDLVYVGRFVSDKGIDLLIDALGRLASRGLRPNLTLVGSGPEEAALRAQAERVGVSQQINLIGNRHGEALATTLNQHKVMVVPSRWREPFGIVALEGLASGCRIVASHRGGLPEAAGPEAHLFEPDQPEALDEALRNALNAPPQKELSAAVQSHLNHHTLSAVGARFELAFAQLISNPVG